MITRSRAKRIREEEVQRAQSVQNELEQNIETLPKEVIMNLLLFLEPSEVRLICSSDNPKIKQICSSSIFREAYKRKFPKKLLQGDINITKTDREVISITDSIGNMIRVEIGIGRDFEGIEYIPYKQMYPSTYMNPKYMDIYKRGMGGDLHRVNPMKIILYRNYVDDKGFVGDEFVMDIGRPGAYGLVTIEDGDRFCENYNQEVKEFLTDIEREKWWSPNINCRDKEATKEAMLDFYHEVVDIIKNYKYLKSIDFPKLQ